LAILGSTFLDILLGIIELVGIAIGKWNSLVRIDGRRNIDNNSNIRIGNIWSIVCRLGSKFKISILGILEINSTND
jgi:hypothetical protein